MKPELWLALGAGLFGVYLFILGWNVLAAALSYMGRTRQRHFPLERCVLAAAGPSAVPVSLPLALWWWGCSRDAGALAFGLSWWLSFWGSGTLERRLPGSQTTGHGSGEASRDLPRNNAPSDLTNAQAGLLTIVGALKSWLALALGVASGYGVGATVAWLAGVPFQPPSWTRLTTSGSGSVLVLYGMVGFLVECLRFQGGPGDRPGLAGWSAARRLRFRLLACLAGAALCIGLYASLWR
jgi:hypothetical protein